MHVRFLPPLHIYMRPLLTSPSATHLPYMYMGGKQRTRKTFNFTLIYTKCYADFRSGLRFGCYQRIFSRYVICLASEATFPLQWDLFLGAWVSRPRSPTAEIFEFYCDMVTHRGRRTAQRGAAPWLMLLPPSSHRSRGRDLPCV